MKPSIQSSIRRAIKVVILGSYTADTIKLLYVDLRDYCDSGSITREIGDYIAHPKEKDRGISHVRVAEQFTAFRKMADLLSGRLPGQKAVIQVKSAFGSSDIVDDLVRQLMKSCVLSKDEIQALQMQIHGITTSVICLLQDSVIKVGKDRLSAYADFFESKLSLVVQYPIDYRGSPLVVQAVLIEGLLPQTSIAAIEGHTFSVDVSSSAVSLKFENS
jgi:hypothetical protein